MQTHTHIYMHPNSRRRERETQRDILFYVENIRAKLFSRCHGNRSVREKEIQAEASLSLSVLMMLQRLRIPTAPAAAAERGEWAGRRGGGSGGSARFPGASLSPATRACYP